MALNGDTSFEEILRVVDIESDFNKDNEGIKKTILGNTKDTKVDNGPIQTSEYNEHIEPNMVTNQQQDMFNNDDLINQLTNMETSSLSSLNMDYNNPYAQPTQQFQQMPQQNIMQSINNPENYDDFNYDDFDINNI
jgi:hypothetical protein